MFEYLTSNSQWLGPLVLLRAEAALLLLECPLVLQTAWGSYVTTLAPGWTHGGIVHCDHVTILFACSSLFWDDPYWYCMIGHVMYNICILVLESLVLRGIDILKFHGHHWASKISKVRRDKVKSTPFFWVWDAMWVCVFRCFPPVFAYFYQILQSSANSITNC